MRSSVLPLLKPNSRFPKAMENFDPNAQQFGGGEVAEFVNQDHESKDTPTASAAVKNPRHINLFYSTRIAAR